jgi:hypothetical protein
MVGSPGEYFQFPAHKIKRSSHGGVAGVEPFGQDCLAFVVVHAVLDAAGVHLVPQLYRRPRRHGNEKPWLNSQASQSAIASSATWISVYVFPSASMLKW